MRILLLLLSIPLVTSAVDTQELECMARNIYFEARAESEIGQAAVAQVVLHRVRNSAFPDTICGVIEDAELYTNWRGTVLPLRHKCQFSWFCDGLSDEPTDTKAWLRSIAIAQRVIDGYYPDLVNEALWYHAVYIKPPWWALTLEPTIRIDNHVFYREF